MTAKAIYLGALRVEATHLKSGEIILSDAPVDNNGKGEAFSPTDMVATALASCMLTVMGIVAARKGWDMTGSTAEITKVMASNPRRIAKIAVVLKMNKADWSDEAKKLLEKTAHACPVGNSLHSDLEQEIIFEW
jgi:uncharacterized OsmC-like protein